MKIYPRCKNHFKIYITKTCKFNI